MRCKRGVLSLNPQDLHKAWHGSMCLHPECPYGRMKGGDGRLPGGWRTDWPENRALNNKEATSHTRCKAETRTRGCLLTSAHMPALAHMNINTYVSPHVHHIHIQYKKKCFLKDIGVFAKARGSRRGESPPCTARQSSHLQPLKEEERDGFQPQPHGKASCWS